MAELKKLSPMMEAKLKREQEAAKQAGGGATAEAPPEAKAEPAPVAPVPAPEVKAAPKAVPIAKAAVPISKPAATDAPKPAAVPIAKAAVPISKPAVAATAAKPAVAATAAPKAAIGDGKVRAGYSDGMPSVFGTQPAIDDAYDALKNVTALPAFAAELVVNFAKRILS